MSALHSTDSIRKIEHHWLASLPAGELMRRAAQAVAAQCEVLLRDLPRQTLTVALIGPGNNGADALLALQLLQTRGYPVLPVAMSPDSSPGDPDGAAVWQAWRRKNGRPAPASRFTDLLQQSPLVIDGLFGIGLSRPLTGIAAELVSRLNASTSPVVSVDVPSGIDADRGSIVGGQHGVAVKADITVTMIADKPGLHTGAALDHVGQLLVDQLGLDSSSTNPVLSLFDEIQAARLIRARSRDTNKGSFGSVSVIGGAQDMQGAALLAASGAAAAGSGKVFIASPSGALFDPGRPHLMTRALKDATTDIDAICIGCGLGLENSAQASLAQVLQSDVAAVIDADALTLIAHDAELASQLRARTAFSVLTPHPLEAARLLAQPLASVQADRIASACRLASQFNAVVVLKGAGSVVSSPDGRVCIISSGSPALASAGTGDVLAGFIAGLLAQQLKQVKAVAHITGRLKQSASGNAAPESLELAALGSWLHGRAGDCWQGRHPNGIGLAANQLPDLLIDLINDPLGTNE